MSDSNPLSRRLFTLGAIGAGAAALIPAGPSTLPAGAETSGARPSTWSRRATSAWQALQQHFAAEDGSGLYRESYPVQTEDPTYSYEWPYSQAHQAALDLTGMSGGGGRYRKTLKAHDRAQQHYWSDAGTTGLPGFASAPTAPYGSGGDFFYDDNEWVGLLDVQHWAMHRDRRFLREAETLFDLVVSGWDDDASHAAPGGVFWTQATWSTDRNTVSNMPGAELGLRLHQITGRRRYLDWSLRMYRWTNRYLQRDDGLYCDHLDLEGTIEPTVWSYNQGVPIGVNALLGQVTGQRRYFTEARRIARAADAYFGSDDRLHQQPVFFNSIYFKNLLLAESITGGHRGQQSLRSYAEWLWSSLDPKTRLHPAGDDGRVQMIEQAATVQIFAALAWPTSRHHLFY
ncbi:MAG: glycoside hydrolase family 76 protein [Propionibacteriaceae bacterium]